MQTLSGQNDLLIGLDVLTLGDFINIAVVDYGTALAAQTHFVHELFKVFQRIVTYNDFLCIKAVLPATGTPANIF